MDELRFRSQQSPRVDSSMTNNFASPPRNGGARQPQQQQQQQQPQQPQQPQPAHDPRANMPRRFTTDSGRVPTLSSMTNSLTSPPRGLGLESTPTPDYANAMHTVQLIEQKKAEYERIRQQRQQFELQMQILDQAQRREEHELAHLQEEVGRLSGHQSEPTTPPEYRENSGFPTIFSRPHRYSASNLASPPGLFNRPGRSGSQLTSPPSGQGQLRYGYDGTAIPSRSVPTTRRNSDDEKEEAVRQDPTSHRSTNAHNRYSMPVTKSRNGLSETILDQTNTTRFLFGDDEPHLQTRRRTPDDNFPTLVRREDQMSLSSVNGSSKPGESTGLASAFGGRPSSFRHSLDLKYIAENTVEAGPNILSPQTTHPMASPPRLQSSFSSNDVPTVKNPTGSSMMSGNANNHAQQHFHNHNASMGRIPAGALARGHARELSADATLGTARDQTNGYHSIQSALQGSAAPFGPSLTTASQNASVSALSGPPNMSPSNSFNGFYPSNGYGLNNSNGNAVGSNYGVPMLTAGLQQMNMNGVNGNNMYAPQNYGSYGAVPYNQNGGQHRDSQARVIQHRRQLDSEAMAKFQNMPLESFRGQLYELCKDQHGCRFLQKKLEERNADQVHTIWAETNEHVIELMTDPFGNYLCQKLLEFCSDDERTIMIQNASKDMVRIALNQHGTRALQKMIEYVNTPQQVLLIIEALRFRVVDLIQDLNGNHVIQKCLNKLSPADAEFIFDAVGNNCIEVGTHRHGCCVLQRCIDHASGEQKPWLVQRITEHATILVRDPFGNYVVQYIIDLNEPSFTEPVVAGFRGCIGELSRHKFSSNVIEKCLRCAQPPSKDMIVEELLAPHEVERLLRDNYANYVMQTALEFATPHMKYRLVEAIRPILPQIRTTPYGRRIQAKVSAYDNRGSAASSGQATPADNTQGQIPLRSSHHRGMSGNGGVLQGNLPPNGGIPSLGGPGIRSSTQGFPNSAVLAAPPPPAVVNVAQQPQQTQPPHAQAQGQAPPPLHQRQQPPQTTQAQQAHGPQPPAYYAMGQTGYVPAQPPSVPGDANGETRWL